MASLNCPLCCGRSFRNRKSLRYHLLSSAENICCPECKQHFSTILQLSVHLNAVCKEPRDEGNPSSQTSNACPLCCGRCFTNRKSLWYHLLSSAENICCPECNQHFNTILELSDHLDTVCSDPLDDQSNSLLPKLQPSGIVEEVVIESNAEIESLIESGEELMVKQEVLEEEVLTAMSIEGCEVVEVADIDWVDGNEEEVHFCSSCKVKIKSVVEHISTYHPYQTVYYETGTSAEELEASGYIAEEMANLADDSHGHTEEVDAAEQSDDEQYDEQILPEIDESREEVIIANTVSLSNQYADNVIERENIVDKDNLSVMKQNIYLDNNLVTEAATQYLHNRGFPANVSPTKLVANESLKMREKDVGKLLRSKLNSPGKVNTVVPHTALDINPGTELVDMDLEKNKTTFPRVLGTVVKTSDLVDTKTGIPYVRKMVRIEKFWERDDTKNTDIVDDSKLEAGEITVSEVLLAKKKRTSPIKNFPIKAAHKGIEPKVLSVQSHLEQLLRSGANITVEQSLPKGYVEENGVFVEESGLKKPKRYVLKNGVYVAAESSIKKMLGHEYALDQPEEIENETSDIVESVQVNFNKTKTERTRVSILKFIQDNVGENMIPIYSCSKCTKEFSNPSRFKSHKCRIKPNVILMCDICGVSCKTPRLLKAHVESHKPEHAEKLRLKRVARKKRSDIKPSTCEICNTQFTTFGGLRMHMRMHRPDNVKKIAEMNNKCEFRCDLCYMVCYSERTFRIHYKIHYMQPTPKVITANNIQLEEEEVPLGVTESMSCTRCFLSFTNNEELKDHWMHHCTEQSTTEVVCEETVIAAEHSEEYFTCTECGKNMSINLQESHENMHRTSTLMFCGKCNKHFEAKTQLELHIANAHSSDVDLECPHCKMKFFDETLLRAHVMKHSGTVRPYPCGFCGRRFSRPHEKVKHERIHTGEMPYECEVCSMRFRVAYCLKMHERIHTGIRPYSCDQCGKTFRTRSGYKQHIRIHSDLRAYQCKFCPKAFKTVVQLSGHRKSHTKPYTCNECSRRFATMFSLRHHLSVHQKIDALKHKCHVCGASYGRDYALKDHLKIHGKKVLPLPDMELSRAESSQEESDLENDSE